MIIFLEGQANVSLNVFTTKVNTPQVYCDITYYFWLSVILAWELRHNPNIIKLIRLELFVSIKCHWKEEDALDFSIVFQET